MCWCEASWGQLRDVGDKQVQISVGRGRAALSCCRFCLAMRPHLGCQTPKLGALCHPGVSNQKNFVLGAAGASETSIPLENRKNKKGYTFLSMGL